MKRLMQSGLLATYRILRRGGLLATPVGQLISHRVYAGYKAWLERDTQQLAQYVAPGTTVLDVGANIGFFTLKFGRWVSSTGRVIAIEPEPANCRALEQQIRSAGLTDTVDIIQAAASDVRGKLFLTLNPDNPADHRIGSSGILVESVMVDDLLSARNWPAVSFLKIDVQGAERRVLAGAVETLKRCRPHIFIELDDEALRTAGSSRDEVIDVLTAYGYQMYALSSRGARSVTRAEAQSLCLELGYADFLFSAGDQAK